MFKRCLLQLIVENRKISNLLQYFLFIIVLMPVKLIYYIFILIYIIV
jgi:hypothetical protein